MNLNPVGERVLIRVDEQQKVTDGGLHLPDSALQRSQTGVVLALGQFEKGTTVRVGDRVMFSAYRVEPIPDTEDGRKLMVGLEGILAVITPDVPVVAEAKSGWEDSFDAVEPAKPEAPFRLMQAALPGATTDESLGRYQDRMKTPPAK